MNKRILVEAIVEQLKIEIALLEQAARAAHEAATHEESKSEDAHDTRGLEASYLAGAQAERANELHKRIAWFRQLSLRDFSVGEAIASGALVELESGGRRLNYFFLQRGGGISVSCEGRPVQVITPQSPLGEEMEGLKSGDSIEIESSNGARTYRVCSVT